MNAPATVTVPGPPTHRRPGSDGDPSKPPPRARLPREPIEIPDRVALRALRSFTWDPLTGCHLSTYSTGSHGHAQIGWRAESGRRIVVTAQRAAWVAMWTQIPEGMVVRVTCLDKRCVNPAHLQLMSNPEAARRNSGRDWPLGECANGHPDSLRIARGEKTACAQCLRDRDQRSNARRRGRPVSERSAVAAGGLSVALESVRVLERELMALVRERREGGGPR